MKHYVSLLMTQYYLIWVLQLHGPAISLPLVWKIM